MPTPCQYATPAARQAAYLARCRHAATATGFTVPGCPGYRRWVKLLAHIRTLLETIQDEMAAYREERSEAWQESERGELFREQEEAVEDIRALMDDFPLPER